jgi:hypothetical protein
LKIYEAYQKTQQKTKQKNKQKAKWENQKTTQPKKNQNLEE